VRQGERLRLYANSTAASSSPEFGYDLRMTARGLTLAFSFPVVDGRRAELVLHWGTVAAPLRPDVP
jgi:hypothetical protein